jgi:PPM family protein phosphatase
MLPPSPLTCRAALLSDRGRVRPQNEDAGFADVERGLYVLSDGVGGHQGGVVASQLVASMAPTLVERELHVRFAGDTRSTGDADEQGHLDAIQRAVVTLNAEVRQRGAQNPSLRGLGATMVLALVRGATAYVAHVGDSRLYLLRHGALRRLTQDHTIANMLRSVQGNGTPHSGAKTPGKAAAPLAFDPPSRHQLARYVGMDGSGMPDVQSVPLQAGDRLLFCSDGLTGMLPERMIAHLLKHQDEPEGACRVLVGAANEAGGRDNVTTIAVYVDAAGRRGSTARETVGRTSNDISRGSVDGK